MILEVLFFCGLIGGIFINTLIFFKYHCNTKNKIQKMIQTEAYFEHIQSTLIGELKDAKRSVYVAVAWFTDTQLFDVLIEKLRI